MSARAMARRLRPSTVLALAASLALSAPVPARAQLFQPARLADHARLQRRHRRVDVLADKRDVNPRKKHGNIPL